MTQHHLSFPTPQSNWVLLAATKFEKTTKEKVIIVIIFKGKKNLLLLLL
jgi:hypothetical protein